MKQRNQVKTPLASIVPLKGRSYQDIAKLTGATKSVTHRWLTGQAIPRPGSIAKLARALGVAESRLIRALYAARGAA
jgi:transcriptional regulator with XRE-family HTH domain